MSPRGLRSNQPNDTPPWPSGFQSPEKCEPLSVALCSGSCGDLLRWGPYGPWPCTTGTCRAQDLCTCCSLCLECPAPRPPPLIQAPFPERPSLATPVHTTTPFPPPRDPVPLLSPRVLPVGITGSPFLPWSAEAPACAPWSSSYPRTYWKQDPSVQTFPSLRNPRAHAGSPWRNLQLWSTCRHTTGRPFAPHVWALSAVSSKVPAGPGPRRKCPSTSGHPW